MCMLQIYCRSVRLLAAVLLIWWLLAILEHPSSLVLQIAVAAAVAEKDAQLHAAQEVLKKQLQLQLQQAEAELEVGVPLGRLRVSPAATGGVLHCYVLAVCMRCLYISLPACLDLLVVANTAPLLTLGVMCCAGHSVCHPGPQGCRDV